MTISQKPKRVVIYARISDDREGRQNGVKRQEEQCRKTAARNGEEVVRVFVDDDRSAYSGKLRPEYARMIEYLEAGHAVGVLALAPTRLYRKLYEPKTRQDYLHFHDLVQRLGLHVQTVKAGRFDLSTADGRKSARDAASQAQYESELIGERVEDAKRDNVRDGTFRGGGRPFGFEADGITPRSLLCPVCGATEGFRIITVTHDEGAVEAVMVECPEGCTAHPVNAPGSEAWHLESATQAIADGKSVRSVLRTWQTAGVRTPARRKRLPDGTRTEPISNDWTPTTLLKLLRRPRNAGLMEVTGEITGKGAWPEIVDRQIWDICQAVLKNPARRTSPGPARKFLGGGLYLCGVCREAATTTGRGRARNGSSYTCGNGQHVSRNAAAVDQFAERVVIARLCESDAHDLFTAPAPETPAGPSTAELTARHAALTARLKGLAAAFADDDDSDPVEFKAAARRIKEKIADVDRQLAEAVAAVTSASSPLDDVDLPELARRHAEDPDEALKWWREQYSLETRQRVLAALVTVTIHPAEQGRTAGWRPGSKYFRPESVDIDWTPRTTA
ncbi:recombinase family protein [Streptomyces sp. GESEQ-35]|uniref:recombinase family protein n=1 Tax=Streptomyces sp. GESEQ-35 TaxID=2812657 RepID=UPI001B3237B5|nr:recombinase family protein [Streptomyces sp. GESEQ-35]